MRGESSYLMLSEGRLFNPHTCLLDEHICRPASYENPQAPTLSSYLRMRRRTPAAKPRMPVPSRTRVEGSGVAAVTTNWSPTPTSGAPE